MEKITNTELAITRLLKKNKLSVTGSRKKYSAFLDHTGALAHGDIEKTPAKNLTG